MPWVLIVRHAIAMERDEALTLGISDAERPLSDKGRQRMTEIATGLQQLIDTPALILSSPLLRARQTADILAEQFHHCALEISDTLLPDRPLSQPLELLKQQSSAPLMLVGHEPALSALTARLLCGGKAGHIHLKKGGGALLWFDRHIEAGGGELHWLLPPGVLRKRS